jgi:hypothetical protein
LDIEPLVELPEPVAEVVPPVVLPVELPVPAVEPVDDELRVPLTSTRLPTFDAERSDEVPSRTYVDPEPLADPAVPAVLPVVPDVVPPAVELVPDPELDIDAFVKM